MNRLISFAAFFSLSTIVYSQVGIGTTNPNAILDIQSSNQAAPANNDGILIPKIEEFPITFPTAAQDGMMVFATGAGSVSKGFYYWDDTIPNWVPITTGSGGGHDWYEEGTTTSPNSINDSIYTYGNVAIGKNTATYKLDIFENAADNVAYINLAGASNNPVSVLITEITNTGDGDQRGVHTILNSSGMGNHYGVLNTLSGGGIGFKQGIRNELSGTSNGSQTGTRNFITNSGNGTHWGVYNTLSGIGTGNHIGTQNTFSDTGSGFHTGYYNTFSEGTGILTGNWTEFGGNIGSSTSNQIAAYNSYFAGGDGILAGSYTDIRSSVTGNGIQYGSFLNNSSSGSGTHYGIRNELAGTGTGDQEGVSTLISNSNNANHFGLNTRLNGTGSGTHIGAQFSMSNIGSGFHTGLLTRFTEGTGILTGNWIEFGGNVGSSTSNQIASYNSYFAGGNGILAGAYTDIRSSVTGTGSQYGSYTTNSSPGGGTHYGSENVLGGTGTGEQYGVYNTISNTGDATHAGVRNILSGTGSGAHIGAFSTFNSGTGNLTGNWIEFGGILGNGNQICAYNSYFSGGNGILAGAYTEIRNSVTGTGIHYGTFTSNDSPGGGIHYGTYNSLSGTGTGAKYGSYNTIPVATGGIHYGVYSDAQKAGSYAGYFLGNILGSRRLELTATTDASGTVGSGVLEIGGSLRIDGNEIITNTNSTLNLQNGNNGDLRIDGTTMVVDATNNRVGIGIVPGYDLHIKQSAVTENGTGGLTLEDSSNTDNWKIYHSGFSLSFAENGVRRGYITGATGAYVATSDRRLKKHIIPTRDVVSKLKDLVVYNYLYKDQNDSAKQTIGFMAQDVQPLFSELVETDEDGYLGLNYSGFGVIAIKAIQEQQTEIQLLKQQLEEQKAELLELKNLIISKQ